MLTYSSCVRSNIDISWTRNQLKTVFDHTAERIAGTIMSLHQHYQTLDICTLSRSDCQHYASPWILWARTTINSICRNGTYSDPRTFQAWWNTATVNSMSIMKLSNVMQAWCNIMVQCKFSLVGAVENCTLILVVLLM